MPTDENRPSTVSEAMLYVASRCTHHSWRAPSQAWAWRSVFDPSSLSKYPVCPSGKPVVASHMANLACRTLAEPVYRIYLILIITTDKCTSLSFRMNAD